jgi:septum formation protein
VLTLASTSKYRRELLERLNLPFECVAPNIDETQHAGESPLANCRRLAREKAQHVARMHPSAVVIGSDQVLDLDGEAMSKPGDFDTAFAQLKRCQGRELICYTALAVVAPNEAPRVDVVPTTIVYRNLRDDELIAYLEREKPFDAAGAVKAIKSDDPTAIIGLPLIRLIDFLRELDYPLSHRGRGPG